MLQVSSVDRLIADQAITNGAQQKPAELAEFLGLLRSCDPQVIVEIGSYSGGTLYAWTRIAPVVIGIDNTLNVLRQEFSAQMIIGDSHSTKTVAVLEQRLAGRPIDCLFIDGDHSYDGVRQDYEMYQTLVRPGGLIAFHDIVTHQYALGCEVVKLWCEVRDESAVEIVSTEGDHWGGIGVLTRA